ncbi:MAG: LicD family protein [Lachnospiraceae bacterium]|nr:LicD family protein [Lachnospiraceae bacterium]
MLEFPVDYFQEEVREGFLVDSTMKTVWAAELEVLNEIAAICQRHGLKWYAAYGTLLGVVRHQGFIPWDDDIDIWMKREDYRKILELLPRELPKEYVVRPPYAREGYPEYQVYVNNSDSISIEPEHLQQFHGCPFYVGIDIFPLDAIPAAKDRADMQRSVFASALMLQQMDYDAKIADAGKGGSIKSDDTADNAAPDRAATNSAADGAAVMLQIGKVLDMLWERYKIKIDRKLLHKEHRKELLMNLWRVAEGLPFGEKSAESHQIAMYLDYLKFGKCFEASWFEGEEYLPFEGFDLPVPGNYDAVLKAIYGDYRVCVKSQGMHDYPCYKKQLEELRKRVAEVESRN